jgi:hypothetical protein
MATTMPTWLTGLFVTARMATSASARPRKSQMSPVDAVARASSRAKLTSFTGRNLRTVRVPWKLVGVAGLAGVAATGVVLARKRRAHHDYDPEELRERLHRRLSEIDTGGAGTDAPAGDPAEGERSGQ